MKSILLKKSMLTVVITLSTASVYYAQSVKDTLNREADIEQVVLTGVADLAKDRKTPVAVSTIKEEQIIKKLGNQEFPEILNTTPSVYATKGGGGFGDSRVNVRGFDQVNTAVLINGVPINDMENGSVYWSNWAGLADVTSAMQVQRGLGSSKLAIASVGGTINILTRSADKKRQANVTLGVGNDGYYKSLFSYNTGKSEKGWSSSFLVSRTAGSMYADGTEFEGYNYYFALGFNPSEKHDLQFTITGAPQWHNQRSFSPTIAEYQKYSENGEIDRRYNLNWGYKSDETGVRREYSFARNYYHKPVMSLNWDWTISPASKLSTVVYASFGRGGGTGTLGKVNNKTENGFRTSEGYIDFDAIVEANQAIAAPGTGANAVFTRRSSINSHNWIGAISSFNHKINENLNFSVGVDARYYKGIHYRVSSDLLGAKYIVDNTDINNPNRQLTNTYSATPNWNPFGSKTNEEKIVYYNDGIVKWLGGFGQLEYSNDLISAFVQGSVSNQGFQRVDYFLYAPNEQKTKNQSLTGYNVKGGANFNISSTSNIFGNIGYYERQPFFGAVFLNNRNDINENLTNEKIFSAEIGYGYRSPILDANVNVYRTSWDDIYKRISYRDAVANKTYYASVLGINEIHQGVELDFVVKAINKLRINGMLSVGDWYYNKDVTASFVDDETREVIKAGQLLIKDVKVGDAAQLTASLGADLDVTNWFSLDASYRYADKLYSSYDPAASIDTRREAIELPSFGLLDAGASFKFKLNKDQGFRFRVNVNNVLDETYIAESRTSILPTDKVSSAANAQTYQEAGRIYDGIADGNQVYFGFGRTWNASVTFTF
ncbi:TonB-dependent receptor plug domain-containing protein [Kaistella sp. 97-N-M2]|uniref:TonB-dependent receptor n=1 Tax=Kaistella sp. 97-N-M2 TaxID=2908645 RepID=UPI001F489F0E|nr:TonB-dependent receptor plug domain-containing protein [Kaistella sp. 97-N-M2]UJF30685.1 TonB-dependent receptor plug domain-containing protein [Kaistella sp. 97-N-M2]